MTLNEENFVISLEDDEDDDVPQLKPVRKRVIGRIEQMQKQAKSKHDEKHKTQTSDDLKEKMECSVISNVSDKKRKRKSKRQNSHDTNEKAHNQKRKIRHPQINRHRPIIERMSFPLAKFRASAKRRSMPQSIKRYRRSVKLITRQIVKADKSWVGFMITLGTIDLMVNIVNFVQMSDSNLEYGLVIGPPSTALWQLLLGFTIVSWFLYFFETLNSFSLLYSISRETYLPIPFDLIITLIFKHIPLTTVVYFISKSRRDYTSGVESVCNGFRIFYILMRIIWYAHIEGRKLRKNEKHPIQKVIIFICCMLFCVATSFAIQNWRKEPTTQLQRYHLINVSIAMFHENRVLDYIKEHRFPPERLTFNFSVGELIEVHGYDLDKPWLMKSILVIKLNNGSYSFHNCSRSNSSYLKPTDCNDATYLIFRFVYEGASFTSPYGEINYNYAKISQVSKEKNESINWPRFFETGIGVFECIDSVNKLPDGWQLYYLEFSRTVYRNNTNDTNKVFITAPFRKSWTHPRPRYNPDIQVCSSGRKFSQFFVEQTEEKEKKPFEDVERVRTVYFPIEHQ